MRRFTAKIVDMMKQEKLYASQGGPIILSQVCFSQWWHWLHFKISTVTHLLFLVEELAYNYYFSFVYDRLKMNMAILIQLMVLRPKPTSNGQHPWLCHWILESLGSCVSNRMLPTPL